MDEIEVKVLEIDKDAVIDRLVSLGSEKVFDGPLYAVYFVNDSLPPGSSLRLRRKGDKSFLTFKTPVSVSDVKVCDELEVEVSDFDLMKELFLRLGFRVSFVDSRRRISFRVKNSLVEIDLYDNIPPFLEVESPSKDELVEVLGLLGFSLSQAKPWDRKQLINYYRNKN